MYLPGACGCFNAGQNRPVETREDGSYPRSAVRDRTRAHAARSQVGGGVQDTLADTIQHGVEPVGRQRPDAIGNPFSMSDRKHTEGPEKVVMTHRSGADDECFPRERQLRRYRLDATSGAMGEDDRLGNALLQGFQCFRKRSATRLTDRFELESELTRTSRIASAIRSAVVDGVFILNYLRWIKLSDAR